MGYVQLPLSGNVTQDISPLRNSMFSWFTVNVGQSSAPEVEEAVLERHSYGRQLGRIEGAMLALLDVLESDFEAKFSERQKKAIRAFRVMLDEIEEAKKEARQRPRPKTWWQAFLPG
jgi:hypothetical protein